MEYYILVIYGSEDSQLLFFDNLNKALNFIKELYKDQIEEFGEVIGHFELTKIEHINPNFKDWTNGEAENKVLL